MSVTLLIFALKALDVSNPLGSCSSASTNANKSAKSWYKFFPVPSVTVLCFASAISKIDFPVPHGESVPNNTAESNAL